MTTKIKHVFQGLALVAGLLVGCQEPFETPQLSEVKLELDIPGSPNGRVNLENVKQVFITIQDRTGQVVTDKKLQLFRFNHHFISETITLPEGSFTVTRFLVLDEEGNVLYATPIAGSAMANLVENPLPVNFTIEAGKLSSVYMEVLAVDDYDPADFGYTKFSFSIFDPCDEVTATVNDTEWCGVGQYLIAYGIDPPLLQLIFKNQYSVMGIRVRYTGLGEYDLAGTNSEYYGYGEENEYTVISGKLTITHAPSAVFQDISGTFQLELQNNDGSAIRIENGEFTKVKGMGY